MLPSSLSMQTLNNGLYIQQLNEDITASNLANPYLDSNGYLMNSLEQVNASEGVPYPFTGPNGASVIGSGPNLATITRLRSSFLDGQIQTQSSVVGYQEILANILPQINSTINSVSGTTLDATLTAFANSWAALAASPTSVALRSAVVNAGVAFANTAHTQYSQLKNLQQGLDGQVQNTVTQINQILQQLSSINKELLTSAGSNTNPVLDARDYALDLLSRLINIQVNYGSNGTVAVYLGGSNLDLVDSAGASILQTNSSNGHDTDLVGVTLQSSEGSQMGEISQSITGGNLGGELYARDTVLDSYETQIDQIATSVMNVTNVFHEAGYALNGTTTGTYFFTGTGAADINVNGGLVSDPTRALLAAALIPGTPTDGTVAQYLSNLPNLLANNFIESYPQINNIGGPGINPTASLLSQAGNFHATPNAAGTFTVNGSPVSWNNGQTIDQILQAINAADPNVYAVFNTTDQQFMMFSDAPINIVDTSGNFTLWGVVNNALTSSIRMNNYFAYNNPPIDSGIPIAMAGLNSAPGGNLQAFRVTPSLGGSFTINGVTIKWFNNGSNRANFIPGKPGISNESLNRILTSINTSVFPGTNISVTVNSTTLNVPNPPADQTFNSYFLNNPQTITIFSSGAPVPINIVDNTGNFTVFTGLNANTAIGNLASGILTNVQTDMTNDQNTSSQAAASLTQLNNAQANIGAVATTPGQPGVPIATIQQQALQSMIAFNASLEVLQVIDQMYSDLIGIVGPAPTSGFFQTQKG